MPKIEEKHWKQSFEADLLQQWETQQPYRFRKDSKKKVYAIDTPPPYVNAPIHMGHAVTYTLMDFFARFHRMSGKEVLFPLGLDRNGLPIEVAAERKYKVKLTEVTREQAVQYCRKILEETSAESIQRFKQLGISFNSTAEGEEPGDLYLTDSTSYRALTQKTFVDLWERGLVYEGDYPSNWDVSLQTTIADSEIEYEELPSQFHDIVFQVKETGESIVIGTTRPELLCACGMVIFHPEDKRYSHLDGKTAVTPVYEKAVPLKAHPAADKDKGTGLVMMCSFGDVADIQFFREQQLQPTIAIDRQGIMNSKAGPLASLPVKQAREKILVLLQQAAALQGSKSLQHRTPVSERSRTPIEFITTKELYLKQKDCKQQLRNVSKELVFYAPESRKILEDWITTVATDWPLSRQRFYGTEIPLWTDDEGRTALPATLAYVQPWKQAPPATATVYDKDRKKIGTVADFPDTTWKGETRIFDTWFDSSISPFYILQWGRDDAFYNKVQPCTLRPQGREIIRTWLYYTLLRGYLLTGEATFKDVWINYYLVDADGRKMSKRLGNGIEPKEVLQKFGAEPFRLWAAIEGNIAQGNMRCSIERIEGAKKTLMKLWNVARFISLFELSQGEQKQSPLDEWIRAEIDALVRYAKQHYEQYDFHKAAQRLKHFLWETFASHYLELVKRRAYNAENEWNEAEQRAAIHTLHYCLEKVLLLFSPIIPFITHKLYQTLYSKDLATCAFPEAEQSEKKLPFTTKDIEALDSEIWKRRSEASLSLTATIKKAVIPEKFKTIAKELQAAHRIAEISYGETIELSFE